MRHPGARILLVAVVSLLTTGACATITTGVDPVARKAGVTAGARVFLRGDVEGLKVYGADGNELAIFMVEDPTLGQAVGNASREAVARGAGAATYTQKMRISPAIFLSQKQDHNIRLVRRDGSSVVIARSGEIAMKYLVIDWLLFAPTIGLSVGIDWVTGKWKDFDEIKVEDEFARAAAATGARR